MSRPFGSSIEDDLRMLEGKLRQLKLEYDTYFLGSRPTEPQLLRSEVQKIITYWSGQPIRNTALRFRFNSLCARFFAMRRQWDRTVRKIEEGTYERHLFKARVSETRRSEARSGGRGGAESEGAVPSEPSLYQELRDARRRCGQGVEGLTPDKVSALLRRQERELRRRYGAEQVQFRVVVENGRARLKATPVRR